MKISNYVKAYILVAKLQTSLDILIYTIVLKTFICCILCKL